MLPQGRGHFKIEIKLGTSGKKREVKKKKERSGETNCHFNPCASSYLPLPSRAAARLQHPPPQRRLPWTEDGHPEPPQIPQSVHSPRSHQEIRRQTGRSLPGHSPIDLFCAFEISNRFLAVYLGYFSLSFLFIFWLGRH